MLHRGLGLVIVSLYATGCMTIGLAIKPKDTPPSHAVIGGVIGDVAIAAGASRLQGRLGDEEVEPFPYVWYYVGGVMLVDAVAAALLHQHQKDRANKAK